ncbi:MAG: hypothetical protein R2757_19225 [Draconibacterium sp.]
MKILAYFIFAFLAFNLAGCSPRIYKKIDHKCKLIEKLAKKRNESVDIEKIKAKIPHLKELATNPPNDIYLLIIDSHLDEMISDLKNESSDEVLKRLDNLGTSLKNIDSK